MKIEAGWCVRYEYGRAHCDKVSIVKQTARQVVIANGCWASGWSTRLMPEKVHATESVAREELARLIAEAIRHKRAEVAAAEDVEAENAARLNALRTPAEPSSSP